MISIGAPGRTTLLEPLPWPSGTSNTQSIFGITVDPTELSSLHTAIQLIVGSDDVLEGVATVGRKGVLSRVQVMRDLPANDEKHGLEHDLVIKQGVKHSEDDVREEMQVFVARHFRDAPVLPKYFLEDFDSVLESARR